jgi:acetyl esterase/lipase
MLQYANSGRDFAQSQRFYEALKAAGVEVDFIPVQDAYHNLRLEEHLPWSDEPWEEMGWKALPLPKRRNAARGKRNKFPFLSVQEPDYGPLLS